MPNLQLRDIECYIDRYGNRRCYRNAWNDWVRWVVLAVVVIGFFFLFFLCSCITARRRRKAGRQPFYGTGWAARPMPFGNQNQNQQPYYNNQYNQGNQPAPPYSAQPQQNSYYGANQGYYGNNQNYGQQGYGQQQYAQYGQQNGVELQSPQATYHRSGEGDYAPPAGPPPGKGDGVIR